MNSFLRDVFIDLMRIIPDKEYLKILFRMRMKQKLNLRDPKTFSEKLQWLKLYERNPLYTTMVDKFNVKEYVSSIIGEEYVIPALGVWDKFSDIDFDALPNQFVLKCTHDSGGIAICRNKMDFDVCKARKVLEQSLRRNYYYYGREWPYKDVKPRIVAEKYMEDRKSKGLSDYKFYCFNGEPKFLYVSSGMENHMMARVSFVSLDWTPEPFGRTDYKAFDKLPSKPENFEEMKLLARKLAKDIPFARIDFYEINGKVYFGEITLFPGSGYSIFNPAEWDAKIGDYLSLPKR